MVRVTGRATDTEAGLALPSRRVNRLATAGDNQLWIAADGVPLGFKSLPGSDKYPGLQFQQTAVFLEEIFGMVHFTWDNEVL